VTPDESALARVVSTLRECGVQHMVTGSVASGHHGRPRMTYDVDVVIDHERAALENLVEALSRQGYYVDRGRWTRWRGAARST
jgi:hypothetical protein